MSARRLILGSFLVALGFALGVFLPRAQAIPTGTQPYAVNAPLTLPATTAVKIGGVIPYRSGLSFCNVDTNTIWIGTTSSVTDSTGMPLYAGTCSGTNVSWIASGKVDLYAYSVAGTVSNGLRWMEDK